MSVQFQFELLSTWISNAIRQLRPENKPRNCLFWPQFQSNFSYDLIIDERMFSVWFRLNRSIWNWSIRRTKEFWTAPAKMKMKHSFLFFLDEKNCVNIWKKFRHWYGKFTGKPAIFGWIFFNAEMIKSEIVSRIFTEFLLGWKPNITKIKGNEMYRREKKSQVFLFAKWEMKEQNLFKWNYHRTQLGLRKLIFLSL